MLSEPSFAEFGKQVILFCHITSHVKSDPYQDLLMKKGGHGWPHLAFLDAKGEVVAAQTITTLESAPLLSSMTGKSKP